MPVCGRHGGGRLVFAAAIGHFQYADAGRTVGHASVWQDEFSHSDTAKARTPGMVIFRSFQDSIRYKGGLFSDA